MMSTIDDYKDEEVIFLGVEKPFTWLLLGRTPNFKECI